MFKYTRSRQIDKRFTAYILINITDKEQPYDKHGAFYFVLFYAV